MGRRKQARTVGEVGYTPEQMAVALTHLLELIVAWDNTPDSFEDFYSVDIFRTVLERLLNHREEVLKQRSRLETARKMARRLESIYRRFHEGTLSAIEYEQKVVAFCRRNGAPPTPDLLDELVIDSEHIKEKGPKNAAIYAIGAVFGPYRGRTLTKRFASRTKKSRHARVFEHAVSPMEMVGWTLWALDCDIPQVDEALKQWKRGKVIPSLPNAILPATLQDDTDKTTNE